MTRHDSDVILGVNSRSPLTTERPLRIGKQGPQRLTSRSSQECDLRRSVGLSPMMPSSMARTAAALVIGTEILTGKIREGNVALLAKELFRMGIEMRRVVVCQDDVATIARDIRSLRADHDYLITSGGVGPTHDDVTMKAVAAAFGVELEVSEPLLAQIRGFVGERAFNEGHRRMAIIPEGAELLASPEVPWPTVVMDNVFVLPGLPRVFQLKMQLLRERLNTGVPFLSRALYLKTRETELTEALDELSARHDRVSIGSYPVWGDERYRVKLTVDGLDQAAVDQAYDALRIAVPQNEIVDDPSLDDPYPDED